MNVTSVKATAVTLLCMLLILVALIFKPPSTMVELEETIHAPLTVKPGSPYVNHFVVHEVLPKLKIDIQSTAPVIVKIEDQEKRCESAACSFVVALQQPHALLRISSNSNATINSLEFSTVKYENKTTLSLIDTKIWLYVLWGLVFLIIFCRIFYQQHILTQWVVIAATMLFLVANDFIFAIILLLFLYCMHTLRYHVNNGRSSIYRLFAFILISIGFLLLFKYGQEGIYSVFANPGNFNLLMPLGISYFVIRLLDVQLRWFRAQFLDISFREFLFFIIFPGTLIAGPIENVKDFYVNRLPNISADDYAYGFSRILIGIFKKIVIADAILYPAIHGTLMGSHMLFGTSFGVGVNSLIENPMAASGFEIFKFAIAGLLFSYVDFSAYSDIAIGLSRILGYKVRENFNFPMLAENIREYWKRWHMSLSEWAFRNVYFPMLVKTQNSYLPLFVTMMIIGLWHAFSLSWFSWAMHHAAGMSIVALSQKYIPIDKKILHLLRPIRTAMTIVFASMGFIFVYLSDYKIAFELYSHYWKWLLFIE